MRVRTATAADQAAVEEIVRAAYEPWAKSLGVRPQPLEADYAALIEAGHVFVTDALDGLIVLVPEEDCLLIENVAVRPDRQGRGIGHRLMSFAEDHARALGLPALRLYTNEKMTSNIGLYASLGYRETAREPIGGGGRIVHMRKN